MFIATLNPIRIFYNLGSLKKNLNRLKYIVLNNVTLLQSLSNKV